MFHFEQLESVRNNPTYTHLLNPVPFSFFNSAKAERSFILFSINRPLTLESLHRRNLVPSPMCPTCKILASTEHYFLFCSCFTSQRSLLKTSFDALKIPFNVTTILTGGASVTGKVTKSLVRAVSDYLESALLPNY